MDKVILGLLIMHKLTVYEIRNFIRQNFKDVCSDSLGAIQAAIKKLLAAEMVSFTEYVEKGVNKKRYEITKKGRNALQEWLMIPAELAEAKNMELGKIFFMGMLSNEERAQILDELIAGLEESLPYLMGIQAAIDAARVNPEAFEAEKAQLFQRWDADAEYYADIASKFDDMAFFNHATLRYGIDLIKFNIEWFRRLKDDDQNR